MSRGPDRHDGTSQTRAGGRRGAESRSGQQKDSRGRRAGDGGEGGSQRSGGHQQSAGKRGGDGEGKGGGRSEGGGRQGGRGQRRGRSGEGRRRRNERGQYVETVGDEEILDLLDRLPGPVITTTDLAETFDITTEGARRKLNDLCDEGVLDRRKSGQTRVYWRVEA
jgi:hypothetical protein